MRGRRCHGLKLSKSRGSDGFAFSSFNHSCTEQDALLAFYVGVKLLYDIFSVLLSFVNTNTCLYIPRELVDVDAYASATRSIALCRNIVSQPAQFDKECSPGNLLPPATYVHISYPFLYFTTRFIRTASAEHQQSQTWLQYINEVRDVLGLVYS